MSEPKKMAILRVDPDVLRDILQLPQDVEVVDVLSEIHSRGKVYIKIEGAGWPVKLGGPIEEAPTGVITQTTVKAEDGTMHKYFTIDWGFPKDLEPHA